MAFFDDLGKKISTAAGAVADKTKELTEVAKLNNEVSKAEKKVHNLYEEIGKIMFEKEKYNTDGPVYQQCNAILAEQQKVLELTKQIEAIKKDGVTVKEQPAAPPVRTTVKPQDTERTCPNCGYSEAEEDFCTQCGAELVQEGEFIEIK